MAESSVDDVLLLWQGAGYYSRARRLHALSIEVVEAHGGVLPETYEELLKLRNWPIYSRSSCFHCFYEPVACVDGNIRRVMARQSNQEEPSQNDVQRFADKHLVIDSPGEWNQAMMELGALFASHAIRFVINVQLQKPVADAHVHMNCHVRRQPRKQPSSTMHRSHR